MAAGRIQVTVDRLSEFVATVLEMDEEQTTRPYEIFAPTSAEPMTPRGMCL